MYIKTVMHRMLTVPTLIATTEQADVLLPRLRSRGWGRFGGAVPQASVGEVVISDARLQLVVDGEILLDDVNPPSPAGWWKAVDQFEGQCAVLVVRDGEVDLHERGVDTWLNGLAHTDQAVFAVLPVVTSIS